MSVSHIAPRDADPIVTLVAANVRAEMGRLKMTQTDVARILGLAKTGASKRYHGITPYTLHDLGLLADAMGTSVEKLCAARDSNPEPAGKRPPVRILPFPGVAA